VAAGSYRPFYKTGAPLVAVKAFVLDDEPVKVEAFLEFVQSEPRWRRSAVRRVFAEPTYLRRWQGDLEPGAEDSEAPVVEVSWFAARAYCESRGGRLPTTVEWERALGASEAVEPGERSAPSGRFAFAQGRRAADLADLAIEPGAVWEWTFDFASAEVAGAGPSQFCGDGVRSNDPGDYGAFLRFSFRSSLRGNYALKDLGFRCASDGPP